MLKEKGRADAMRRSLLVGFLGVLIVTNPGAETFQIGALFALGNAILYGTVTAAVRGMTATESTQTLTLYQLLLITCFFALLLPLGFVMPTWRDWGLIVFNGLSNAIRTILVDEVAASRPRVRDRAVLLSVPGLGGGDRLFRLGRGADRGTPHRVGHRGQLEALFCSGARRAGHRKIVAV